MRFAAFCVIYSTVVNVCTILCSAYYREVLTISLCVETFCRFVWTHIQHRFKCRPVQICYVCQNNGLVPKPSGIDLNFCAFFNTVVNGVLELWQLSNKDSVCPG